MYCNLDFIPKHIICPVHPISISSPGEQSKLAKQFEDCLRAVQQTKWKLIRIRQEQVKSYKEVCAPVIERCKFLLQEVRPSQSDEVNAMDSLPILFKESKFKQTVRNVIQQKRDKLRQPSCDMLNVSLRSLEGGAGVFPEQEEDCFKLKDIVNEELQVESEMSFVLELIMKGESVFLGPFFILRTLMQF